MEAATHHFDDDKRTRLYHPSMGLRFIERDGRKILQQAFSWSSGDKRMGGVEWRDVPLVSE